MEAHKDTARREVGVRLAELGWDHSHFARTAGINRGTVSDFLSGKRWPSPASLAAMDKALAWPPGTLAQIAETGEIPQTPDTPPGPLASRDPTITVGGPDQVDEPTVVSLDPLITKGRTPLEIAEMVKLAELAALQAARRFREAEESRARGEVPREDAAP